MAVHEQSEENPRLTRQPMTGESICAVMVTYHPDMRTLENISQLLGQVPNLVVVDNGSHRFAIESLRRASRSAGFRLIENGKNLGVGEAFNQGVRWAKHDGYAWVALFDQDSRITDSFMQQMFAAWELRADRDRVCALHPRYVNPETGAECVVPRDADGGPIFPMSSGTLMPAWVFDKLGWFESEYFIDLIDWEYCFRIRKAGYLVADAPNATLLHTPGSPVAKKVLGHTFHSNRHSAMRRYYISRNRVVFFRKYWRLFPRWMITSAYVQMKETAVCLLVEEDRARKFRNILLGTWDGLTGRLGKREGL